MSHILDNLKFTFYIYSHPFDGFWIMKKEKTHKWQSSLVLLLLFVLTTAFRTLNSGYLFSSGAIASFSVWLLALVCVAVVLLYCVANWALTTLAEGMGTFEDIFASLMYALTPIIIANIPMTLLSQILIGNEAAFFNFIDVIVILWTVFLILAGNLSIHEYTMVKSIVTVVLSAVAMVAIAVLIFLVCNLTQQVWNWVVAILSEIFFRL